MEKSFFEYKVVSGDDANIFSDKVTKFLAEGWELYDKLQIDHTILYQVLIRKIVRDVSIDDAWQGDKRIGDVRDHTVDVAA